MYKNGVIRSTYSFYYVSMSHRIPILGKVRVKLLHPGESEEKILTRFLCKPPSL